MRACPPVLLAVAVAMLPFTLRAEPAILVDGPPVHDEAHAAEAVSRGHGQYLGSLQLSISSMGAQGARFSVPVFQNTIADEVAAQIFRRHNLPFDHEYLRVHNAINAVVRREEAPADLSVSRAKDGFSKPHPYLAVAEEHKDIFMVVEASVPRAGIADPELADALSPEAALRIVVLEGEMPRDAVERALAHVGVSLSSQETESLVAHVEDSVLKRLLSEEEAARRRGVLPVRRGGTLTEPLVPLAGKGKDDLALEDEMKVQKALYELQHPGECKRALVFSFDRAVWGLAVNVHYMTVLLNYCWLTNRTLVTANPDHWNYADANCTQGWECYFQPISKCNEWDIWQPYTLDVRDDVKQDYRKYLYKIEVSESPVLYFSNTDGPWLELLSRPEYKNYVPEQFEHRGPLWWRSQLTRYVFRPKDFVVKYTDERQAALGWHAGMHVVGLHVRHGDKSWDVAHQGSYFGGLEKYEEKAKRLMDDGRANDAHFFISTDDASVLDEVASLNTPFFWDSEEARYNGTHVYSTMGVSEKRWPGFPGNDPNVDTFRYALDSIKSILLLTRSNTFVGTATSCFSRLVYQLRAAGANGSLSLRNEWTVDSDPRYMPQWSGWFMDP